MSTVVRHQEKLVSRKHPHKPLAVNVSELKDEHVNVATLGGVGLGKLSLGHVEKFLPLWNIVVQIHVVWLEACRKPILQAKSILDHSCMDCNDLVERPS